MVARRLGVPAPPRTLRQTAAAGDRRATLEALRDRLAREIDSDGTPARDLAALAGRLQAVLLELDAIPEAREVDPVADLVSRAARRRATPRVSSVPPSVATIGLEVAELASTAGLMLDPWQRTVINGGFGVLGDGRWSAFEVGLVVPRQNGKGSILEAVELAGLFLPEQVDGGRAKPLLIMHSAHEMKTAVEAFRRILSLINGSDFLRKQVVRVSRSHGDEGIELRNGNRLRFTARSKGAGRGFTADRVVFDEAYNLGGEAMAALLPTLSARPNPQVWYASSAGMATSEQLQAVRARGAAGNDPSLAYYEWSAADGDDPDDPAVWAATNPAFGIRITEAFCRRERAALGPDEFARERLGIWDDAHRLAVIPPQAWDDAVDPDSKPGPRLAFGVDATPDHSRASIAVASRRPDGRVHIEVLDSRKGMAWVPDRMLALLTRWGEKSSVLLDPAGPAGSLLAALTELRVEVTLVSQRELGQACGGFYDGVTSGSIRHLDQAPLNTAAEVARKRVVGDAWAWNRKDIADMSPLLAVTLAAFGAAKEAARPVRTTTGRVIVMS